LLKIKIKRSQPSAAPTGERVHHQQNPPARHRQQAGSCRYRCSPELREQPIKSTLNKPRWFPSAA